MMFIVVLLLVVSSFNSIYYTEVGYENDVKWSKQQERVSIDSSVVQSVESNLTGWVDFWRLKNRCFDVKDFYLMDDGYFNPYETILSEKDLKKTLEDFGPYLKFNSDSTECVNIYDSLVKSVDNGKTVWEMDVDSNLSLLSKKTKNYVRIHTLGPFAEFQDCFWLNDSTIVVSYAESSNASGYRPYLLIIELGRDYKYKLYQLHPEITSTECFYLENIFGAGRILDYK